MTAPALEEIAEQIGRRLAQAVRGDPAVRSLWVSAADERVEVWLLTVPLEPSAARRRRAAGAFLYAAYPDVELRLHVLNPAQYPTRAPEASLPRGARSIPLAA